MNAHSKDPIWETICEEVAANAKAEPMLASFLHATVLNHDSLEDALSFHLASKLGGQTIDSMAFREVILEAMGSDPSIGEAVRADLKAICDRNPACPEHSIGLLYFKGFHALQSYRVAHWLWNRGREALAYYLQSRMAEIFSVDIHPAARLGQGIMFDHADGVVIGETAVVADNVSMLHEVTLGGTGKVSGDRHPKIGAGVMIGAGAKVLGNVIVGEGAKIASGSVVLKDIPAHCTVAGVPAEVIGTPEFEQPALEMNQSVTSDQTQTPRVVGMRGDQ